MCVVCGIHMHVFAYVWVHMHVEAPVDVRNHLPSLFYFIHWVRISQQTQTSLIWLALQARLLWESPVSAFWGSWKRKRLPCLPGFYMHSKDPHFDPHTCMLSALTIDPYPQPWVLNLLKMKFTMTLKMQCLGNLETLKYKLKHIL